MKKHLKYATLLFTLLTISVISAHAQRKFNAGLIGGITITQVDGDTYEGYDKLGMIGGGFVNRMIGKKLSMQMELVYTQKGSRRNPNPESAVYTFYQMKLDYAEIPVFLRYHVREMLIAEAGLSFARLLSSSEEDEYGILKDQKPFNKSDYSVHGGFNVKIYKNTSANFRISHSIVSMRYNSQLSGYYIIGGQYNNVINFTLRYTFNNE